MGVPLTPVKVQKFSDGETYVRVQESVRGCDVYIIQATSEPTNDHLMELLLLVDALKRSSPANITAVIPYYGYCRQDKKHKAREPISAKLVANMLQISGVSRLIFFELHVPQVQGFFDIPSDNLDVLPLFAKYIQDNKLEDFVVVSPDAGGAARARSFAKIFDAPLAIVDKRRQRHNDAIVENVIGDVEGKHCVILDDMIDTGGSITEAAKILLKHGAKDTYAFATHGVFSDHSMKKIKESPLKNVVVTNTIDIPEKKLVGNVKILSVAELLAEDIKRTHEGTSMGVYYNELYKKMELKGRVENE